MCHLVNNVVLFANLNTMPTFTFFYCTLITFIVTCKMSEKAMIVFRRPTAFSKHTVNANFRVIVAKLPEHDSLMGNNFCVH